MRPKRLSTSAWWKVSVCLAVILLASYGTWAAEPEIACRQILQQAITVTVMGADGSDPTVIFKGDKFKMGSTMPKWSPDGEWIAFRRVTNPEVDQVSGIYKIRPDGKEMTQILCAVGSAPGDVSFISPYFPQWSPDGQWILVQLSRLEEETGAENWLGIVRANEEPDENCYSDLIRLYTPDVDPATGEGWNIVYYAPTWTDDGSKIAFFEEQWIEDSLTGYRLQVLDIDDSGPVPTVAYKNPIELPEDLQEVDIGAGVDWQRGGGNILLTDTNDGVDKITWLELDPATYEIQRWGHLTEGWNANWSPQNDRMVYNSGMELRVANIEYAPDGKPVIGDSSIIFPDQSSRSCLWPDWKRGAPPCASAADCNDGNECTADVCSPEGQCLNPPVTDGTACDDGYGTCFEGICETPDCWENSDCSDGDECTTDECVGGECLFTPIPDCGGSCLPKGETCTSDAECCSGSCHPIKLTCK